MTDEIQKYARPNFIKDIDEDEPPLPAQGSLAEEARRLLELGFEIEELDSKRKSLNKTYESLELRLAEQMEDSQMTKFVVDGYTFFTQIEPKPSVSAGENEAFVAWLDNNGHGAIAKRSVHYQTLKAWVKNQLEGAQQIPAMVKVFMKTSVRTRRLPSTPKR